MPRFVEQEDRLKQIRDIIQTDVRTVVDLNEFELRMNDAERYDVDYTRQETDFISRFLFEDQNKDNPELTEEDRSRLLNIQSRNRAHILINDQKFSGDSTAMQTVKTAIKELEDELSCRKEKSADELAAMEGLFDNAIKACESYAASHNPLFSTGKERKRMVVERLESLRTERTYFAKARQALQEGKIVDFEKPVDLIETGRNLSLNLNAQINGPVIKPQGYSWEELNELEIVKKPQFKEVTDILAKRKYGDSFKEKLTSEKRQKERLTDSNSELYKKNINANKLLNIDKDKKSIRLARIKDLGNENMLINQEEAEMTSVFAHNSIELSSLLTKFSSSSIEVRKEAFSAVVKAVLSADLSNIDISTDKAIIDNAKRFADLSELARATEYLKFRHKDVFDSMPEDLKAKFETQRINITRFGVYYELKKSVLTDDYYRDHKDSEISLNADKNTTKEQKRLIFKMHACDNMIMTANLCNGREYKFVKLKAKPNASGNDHFDSNVLKLRKDTAGEFAKTSFPYQGTVHAAYFNDLETKPEYAEKLQLLAVGNYKVAGEKKSSKEYLFRSIGIMANLKEIQEMKLDDVKALVDDLTAVPENDAPEAVETAKQRNLKGLLKIKGIAYRQMLYLKEKYGNNEYYSDPDEVDKHSMQRAKDWVWMCDVTNGLLDYLDELGMIDHKNQDDIELMKLKDSHSISTYAISCNAGLDISYIGMYATSNMSVYLASCACSNINTGLTDYNFKNSSFIYSFVDRITDSGDDLDVHREAEHRKYSSKSEISTVGKMLKLEERKNQRSAQKAEIGELLRNKWSILGFNSDSEEMTTVKDSYRLLVKALNQVPSESNQKKQLSSISKAYKQLLSACDKYIDHKGKPASSDGKERLQKVKRLKAFMQSEYSEFTAISAGVRFENFRSFNEMLDNSLPEEFDLKQEKGKVVSPLEIVTDKAKMWEYMELIPEEKSSFASQIKNLYKRPLGNNGNIERIDEKKRLADIRNPKSSLYKKEYVTQSYLALSADYNQLRVDRLEAASKNAPDLKAMPEEDYAALSFFMDADEMKNEKLLSLYQKEDKTDALQLITWQILNTTIPTMDLSSEEGLLNHVHTLEKIKGMTISANKLMNDNPEFIDQMPEKVRKHYDSKLKEMREISKYYTLRVGILTDEYYRTHYDDELDGNEIGQGENLMNISFLLNAEKEYLEGDGLPDNLKEIDLTKEEIPASKYATREKNRIRRNRVEIVAKHLMMSKWSYFGINPEDSKEMTNVKTSYQSLNVLLSQKLPKNDFLIDNKWRNVTKAYDDVIGFCDVYLKKRNPSTEEGKTRKRLVEELKRQMESDLALVRAGYENLDKKGDITSFEELLYNRQPVTIKVSKLPKNIGNGTSIVYKLDENGEVSYFKPAEKQVDRTNSLDVMEKMVVPQTELQKKLYPEALKAVKKMKEYIITSNVSAAEGTFENLVIALNQIKTTPERAQSSFEEKVEYITDSLGLLDYPEDYPREELANGVQQPVNAIRYFFGAALKKDKTFDEEKFNALMELYYQAFQTFNAGRQMTGVLGLHGDENLAARNVASTRVANLFGVGHVLAKSESACIELPDGKQVYGIKMEEAKGIPLNELTVKERDTSKYKVVVTKQARAQIVTMKILDEICYQADRGNLSNVICDVKETTIQENGVTKTLLTVENVKGIDNDLAFATIYPANIGPALKERLSRKGNIPIEAVEQFINTGEFELFSAVSDVLEQEAKDILVIRFRMIKSALKELMQEHPELFVATKDLPDASKCDDLAYYCG